MRRDPLSWRLLAGASAVVIFLGVVVAACRHDDDPSETGCGTAYTVPANTGRPSFRKEPSQPTHTRVPAPVSKTPRPAAPRPPSPSPYRHGPHPEVDLDLDLGGC